MNISKFQGGKRIILVRTMKIEGCPRSYFPRFLGKNMNNCLPSKLFLFTSLFLRAPKDPTDFCFEAHNESHLFFNEILHVPYFLSLVGTLLDHCLKSLHNTVKHMNLPIVVLKIHNFLYTIFVKLYTSCVIFLHNCW